MKINKMSGVKNVIKEFSSSFEEMNDWKYTVESYEDGVEIKYFEKENEEMVLKNSMNITYECAELLFKTIANDFEKENFRRCLI